MDHAHEKRKPAEERYERDHRDNDLDDDGPYAELLGPLRRIEGTIVVADSPQNIHRDDKRIAARASGKNPKMHDSTDNTR